MRCWTKVILDKCGPLLIQRSAPLSSETVSVKRQRFSECLYQHDTNCPEPTGRLFTLGKSCCIQLSAAEVLNLPSAGGWDRQRGEKERNTPCWSAFVCCRYGDSSPKGAHSPTLGWGENDNESKNRVCVCVCVCIQRSLALPHTHTHGGAAVSAPA